MCWSGGASTALATCGFVCTGLAIRRKESIQLWSALGYFSLVEALQAYTCSVIDRCSMPENQIATVLGYLHITFQPFFVNAVALYFIDQRVAEKIAPFAFTFCFAAAIMMLIKLYPFAWAKQCLPGVRPMCGESICAFHGNWHIAWSLPVRDISDKISWYFLAAFLMPARYGSWRWSLYHLITGPVLERLTTSNLNEWPAEWCLFSYDAKTLRHIIDYCDRKWQEADQAPASDFPTQDMYIGKKVAYNDVLHYARKLLGEMP
jgi:hypothetical protein